MTLVTLSSKDSSWSHDDVENVIGPRPNVPYWEISYIKDDQVVRHFYHTDTIVQLSVEGEQELVAKAKKGTQDNKAFMQEILER